MSEKSIQAAAPMGRDSMPKLAAINRQTLLQKLAAYRKKPGSLAILILVLLSAVLTVGALIALIGYILVMGIPNLSPSLFEWEYNSVNVSMMPAIINTVFMTALALVIAVPLGVFSAIYLVEYAKRGSKLVSVVRITAETLSGIPSIVYGLFGYLMLVIACGFKYSILSGGLTLSIMILPVIMRTTEEALKAVPDSFREGSFALGAGRLRTVFRIVLPCSLLFVFYDPHNKPNHKNKKYQTAHALLSFSPL